jgi:hypothetical protein
MVFNSFVLGSFQWLLGRGGGGLSLSSRNVGGFFFRGEIGKEWEHDAAVLVFRRCFGRVGVLTFWNGVVDQQRVLRVWIRRWAA